MPRLPELAVDALAAHRLVRLVQTDTLPPIARARHTALTRWPDSAAVELLVCPWCLSVHVGALVVALRHLAPRAWAPLAAALAISTVAALIAEHEGA